jgi:hypothetical protein
MVEIVDKSSNKISNQVKFKKYKRNTSCYQSRETQASLLN